MGKDLKGKELGTGICSSIGYLTVCAKFTRYIMKKKPNFKRRNIMNKWYINCETMDEVKNVVDECTANGWAYTTKEIVGIGGKKLTHIEVTEN